MIKKIEGLEEAIESAQGAVNCLQQIPRAEFMFAENRNDAEPVRLTIKQQELLLAAAAAYAKIQSGECVVVPREINQDMQLAGLQAFVDKAVSERCEGFKHLTDEDIDEKSFDYGLQMGREIMNSDFTDAVYKAMIQAGEGMD